MGDSGKSLRRHLPDQLQRCKTQRWHRVTQPVRQAPPEHVKRAPFKSHLVAGMQNVSTRASCRPQAARALPTGCLSVACDYH